MSKMFESSNIGSMELANRFVRSATWEGMAATDGAVTPKLTQTMVDLAKGEVGLIISSHAYICPEGQAGMWQLGVYKDELIEGLTRMVTAVHEAGGKIVAQLAHSGRFANPEITGQKPLSVSGEEGMQKIGAEDIKNIITANAEAAVRAKAAGFDGVQIHSAHGYLLSQFLSPAFNQRSDNYGGTIENRARIHLAIYKAIREAVGDNYPVLIKINSRDYVDNGLTVEDSLKVATMLADAGLDAVELSGGLLTGGKLSPSRMGINREEKEAYFQEDAKAYKDALDIPLILVGGLRSLSVAEKLLSDGVADYFSMSRPLIREPDLVKRWKAGDLRPAQCKSDNMCFKPGMEGKGIYCLTEEREKAKG